ncbi:MAG: DUF1893 domain-containing protein [Clostridia bacterium]|nr:DUF1893 domain-containing protein [Clostridia bacterium]
MSNNASHRVVLSGLLVAIGLLLPYFTAHAFGIPGIVLLPMHLPVFLIGLLCGPMYGALGGLIIPFLSSLLTGMPPFFPMLPIMLGELFTYGFVSGFLYYKVRIPLYPTIVISMLCGRVIYGLIFAVLLRFNNGVLQALSVTGALIEGIPGIIIQLLLLPVIVSFAHRHFQFNTEIKTLSLEKAKQMIKDGKASCVIIKNDKIIRTLSGQGVSPLLLIYENEPEILQGAFVVDKVIGKAAAILLVLGGAKGVYGLIMSAAARDYLGAHGYQVNFGKIINSIVNRTGDGMCPLENSVLDIDNPEIGYHMLKETLKRLRSVG